MALSCHDLKPPCHQWKIWWGKECEGDTDRNHVTLFVRSDFTDNDISLFRKFSRVWFTREFTDYKYALMALDYGCKVCLEITSDSWAKVPAELLQTASLYYVPSCPLKPTDFVKIGPPFSERVVSLSAPETDSEAYYTDVCIR